MGRKIQETRSEKGRTGDFILFDCLISAPRRDQRPVHFGAVGWRVSGVASRLSVRHNLNGNLAKGQGTEEWSGAEWRGHRSWMMKNALELKGFAGNGDRTSTWSGKELQRFGGLNYEWLQMNQIKIFMGIICHLNKWIFDKLVSSKVDERGKYIIAKGINCFKRDVWYRKNQP